MNTNEEGNPKPHCIRVRYKGEVTYVRINEIQYIEALGWRSVFHTDGGEIICGRMLGELTDELAAYGICRCHRAYAVNISRVKAIRSGSIVTDDGELPIGRRYRAQVRIDYEKQHK